MFNVQTTSMLYLSKSAQRSKLLADSESEAGIYAIQHVSLEIERGIKSFIFRRSVAHCALKNMIRHTTPHIYVAQSACKQWARYKQAPRTHGSKPSDWRVKSDRLQPHTSAMWFYCKISLCSGAFAVN